MTDGTEKLAFDGKRFVQDLSSAPGVYRMLGEDDAVLYVGKAGNLKKRVASYFRDDHPSRRIGIMVKQIKRMEVTVTRTEAEALILENQLIKSLKPRYNILLRDDKSYPYIVISDETWPRIAFHRGSRTVAGRYFGPYPSVMAVRDTMDLMQKIFKLANLRKRGVPQPVATLPAASDRALQRALRRPDQPARLRRQHQARSDVPAGAQQRTGR